jgi:hypothetical protein
MEVWPNIFFLSIGKKKNYTIKESNGKVQGSEKLPPTKNTSIHIVGNSAKTPCK